MNFLHEKLIMLRMAFAVQLPKQAENDMVEQFRHHIQFRKIVAWFAMLSLQEPWFDHLTASAQP